MGSWAVKRPSASGTGERAGRWWRVGVCSVAEDHQKIQCRNLHHHLTRPWVYLADLATAGQCAASLPDHLVIQRSRQNMLAQPAEEVRSWSGRWWQSSADHRRQIAGSFRRRDGALEMINGTNWPADEQQLKDGDRWMERGAGRWEIFQWSSVHHR